VIIAFKYELKDNHGRRPVSGVPEREQRRSISKGSGYPGRPIYNFNLIYENF